MDEKKTDESQPQTPPTRGQVWWDRIKTFAIIFLVLSVFRSSVVDWNDVPTGSMKPSILEGDRVLVNKLAYDLKVPFTTWHIAQWGDPKRGDVVVFFSPKDGKRLIKRVLGLPGDTIEIARDQLRVNGEPAEYGPLDPKIQNAVDPAEQPLYVFKSEKIGADEHPVMLVPGAMPALRTVADVESLGYARYQVPPGHYFMMGDNRDNSADSRFIGHVPRKLIVGRASRVVVSVDLKNNWKPRWGRFFTALP